MKRTWKSENSREIRLRDIDVASLFGVTLGVGLVGGAIIGYRKGSLDEEHATATAALVSAALFATFLVNVEYMKKPKVIEVPSQAVVKAPDTDEAHDPMGGLSEQEIERIKEEFPWFGE